MDVNQITEQQALELKIQQLEMRAARLGDAHLKNVCRADINSLRQRLAALKAADSIELGESAYERERAARPTYHDGSPRPAWGALSAIARYSWQRKPRP